MVVKEIDAELVDWLQVATDGLPTDVCEIVEAEIVAHYEDAVADHMHWGKTAVEAHRVALSELGDETETRYDLQVTHLAERRYKIALILGITGPFLMPIAALISRSYWGIFFFTLAMVVPSVYALKTFQILLEQRYHFYSTRRLIRIILFSLVVILVMIGLDVYVSDMPDETLRWQINRFVGGVSSLGLLVIGAMLMLLGDELSELNDNLLGLQNTLRLLLLTLGFCLLMSVVTGLVKAYVVVTYFVVPSVFVYAVLFAFLILLFFRAVYRPTGNRWGVG